VDSRVLLLLAFGLPLPAYMLVQSLWIQVKVNWLTPAYVPLLIGVVLWWSRSGYPLRWPRLARWTVASFVLLQTLVLAAPLVRLVPPGRGSSWEGWDEIAERAEYWEDTIDVEDGREGNVFFFAADYRDAAQLGRNLELLWRKEGEHHLIAGHTDSGEPTLAQNVIGVKALQFDHWERPRWHVGQDAIFVLPRPAQRAAVLAEVGRCFESVDRLDRFDIERLGIRLMQVDIFVCRSYRGPIEGS
jgi:hypothetical protein